MNGRPALLFYCQHSVGLGHLMRSYALCAALTERFRVVLLCGGALPEGIAPPAGVELLPLPPLGVGAAGGFVSHDPRYTHRARRGRCARERILAALRARCGPRSCSSSCSRSGARSSRASSCRCSRRARAAARSPPAACATSSSARAPTSSAYDDRAGALANAHLDAVLVHSDPRFARLEETFAPGAPLRVPVHYTGFVVRDAATGPPRRGGEHVSWCRRAAGCVGEPLLRAALEAAARGRRAAAR